MTRPLQVEAVRYDPGFRLKAGLLVLIVALSLVPMFLAGPVPAMVDYPNHMARMSVLARAGTAAANPFYQTAWALYPNLAMDVVVPPFARLVGVEAATKSFLILSQLLIVLGAVAIELVVKKRLGFAGFMAALLLYSDPFAWGFMNFEFGLGLALLAFAGWIRLVERPLVWRAGFHLAATLVLFVSHMFALGVYGWAVGLYELWRWRQGKGRWSQLAATACVLAAPLVLLAALTAAFGSGFSGRHWTWSLLGKAYWLLGLNGYSWTLSQYLSLALMAVGLVLTAARRWRLEGAGPVLAGGFTLLFVVMPHQMLDTEFVDVRIVVAALLILPSFFVLTPGRSRTTTSALILAGLVGLVSLADVAWVQLGYRSEYAAVRASFAKLPANARVLIGHTGDSPDPPPDLAEYPMYHAPDMAVEATNAFVPTLFTYTSKQPILPRPWIRRLSIPQGGPVPLATLLAAAKGRSAGPYHFAARWTRDFDVVYLVGQPIANPLPAVLEPLASGRRFVMYRVKTRVR